MSGARTVLVAGLPRSGTTWTAEALGRTAGSTLVHEPDNDRLRVAALRAKARLGRYPLLAPGDQASAYRALWRHAASGTAEISGWRNRWAAGRAEAGAAALDQVMADPGGRWPLRLGAAALACRIPSGGERPPTPVVVKSVHCALAVEWVADALEPDAVLTIVRHPANVIGSWRDMGWQGRAFPWSDPRLYRSVADPPPPGPPEPWIARSAWQFALLADALLGAADRHGWVVVDHAELLDDPVAGLTAVAEGLGLVWSGEATTWVDASNRPGQGFDLERLAAAERDRWRGRLAPDDAAVVHEVLDHFPRLVDRWPSV